MEWIKHTSNNMRHVLIGQEGYWRNEYAKELQDNIGWQIWKRIYCQFFWYINDITSNLFQLFWKLHLLRLYLLYPMKNHGQVSHQLKHQNRSLYHHTYMAQQVEVLLLKDQWILLHLHPSWKRCTKEKRFIQFFKILCVKSPCFFSQSITKCCMANLIQPLLYFLVYLCNELCFVVCNFYYDQLNVSCCNGGKKDKYKKL